MRSIKKSISIVGVSLAVAVHPEAFANCDAGPATCKFGFVWRDSFSGDKVCVSGASRSQAASDNSQAPQRRIPGGSDTCIQGFVWREANPADHVCVTGQVRSQTAQENAAASQMVNPVCTAVTGFADTHSHAFSNEGFGGGGGILYGKAYGSLDDSLAHCDAVHGPGGINDMVGMIMHAQYSGKFNWGHSTSGAPEMAGWPRFDDLTHQAVHESMLKRAVDGGLRLIVVHAVNNEWMCETAKDVSVPFLYATVAPIVAAGDLPGAGLAASTIFGTQVGASSAKFFAGAVRPECQDMPSVDRQLAEARAMELAIDAESGGAGKGWFRIVTTPEQAVAVMKADKLAVVLGVEIDNLFGCYATNNCSLDYVRTQLDKYYDQGLRHVFPIHFYDNAFGGSASSNFLITQRFKNPMVKRDCRSLGYLYDGGQCNAKGLTDLGKAFVRELALRGMIIDTDHMSAKSFSDAMDILEGLQYPAFSGHTGFTAIDKGDANNEGNRTVAEIARLKKTRGMVSIIPHQGTLTQIGQVPGAVVHSCGNSSETVAQALVFAEASMPGEPVGIGTDFNGFASEPGPRFGPDACPGGKAVNAPDKPRLVYPFTIRTSGRNFTLSQGVIAHRTYDFNVDGLAHMGLLPDLLADLQNLGFSQPQMDRIYDAASGYARLWDRARDASRNVAGVRRMRVAVSPSRVSTATSESISITVSASDAFLDNNLNGADIFISGQKVGTVGVPFSKQVGIGTQLACHVETDGPKPKRVCDGYTWKDSPLNIEVRAGGFSVGHAQVVIANPTVVTPD